MVQRGWLSSELAHIRTFLWDLAVKTSLQVELVSNELVLSKVIDPDDKRKEEDDDKFFMCLLILERLLQW